MKEEIWKRHVDNKKYDYHPTSKHKAAMLKVGKRPNNKHGIWYGTTTSFAECKK
jgi:hypothetical protein